MAERVGEHYKLRNRQYGPYLYLSPTMSYPRVVNGKTGPGTLWRIVPASPGYWRLVSAETGMCLASSREGRAPILWMEGAREAALEQQWKFEEVTAP